MDRRCPAARHQHHVTFDGFARHDAATGFELAGTCARDPQAARRTKQCRGGLNRKAQCTRRIDGGGLRFRSEVGNQRDLDTFIVQIDRRFVGGVGRGQDDGARPELDAVAVDVSAGSIREHDAGAIVVGEYERPLDRSGCQHHVFCPHLPEPLAWQSWIRLVHVVGDALGQGDKVLREIAECLGAAQ